MFDTIKRRSPDWALLLAVLLGVVVAVVIWLLLRPLPVYPTSWR